MSLRNWRENIVICRNDGFRKCVLWFTLFLYWFSRLSFNIFLSSITLPVSMILFRKCKWYLFSWYEQITIRSESNEIFQESKHFLYNHMYFEKSIRILQRLFQNIITVTFIQSDKVSVSIRVWHLSVYI